MLNDSPGRVDRHYQIQIMANNGEKLGEADIVDDEDLKYVLGVKMKHLLEVDMEERDMSTIFNYIINERIIINLLHIANRTIKSDGRREGVRVNIEQQISSTNLLNDKEKNEDENEDEEESEQNDSNSQSNSNSTSEKNKKKNVKKNNNTNNNTGVIIIQRDKPSDFDDDDISTEDSDRHRSSYTFNHSKYYWLRIYSHRHRLSGRSYRTVIIFISKNQLLEKHSNIYFQRNSIESLLMNEIDVIFNTQDLNGKKQTIILKVAGKDIWKWLPNQMKDRLEINCLSLDHKIRRERFGKWLLEQLRIQYSVLGDYHLELFGMDKELTRNQEVIQYVKHNLSD